MKVFEAGWLTSEVFRPVGFPTCLGDRRDRPCRDPLRRESDKYAITLLWIWAKQNSCTFGTGIKRTNAPHSKLAGPLHGPLLCPCSRPIRVLIAAHHQKLLVPEAHLEFKARFLESHAAKESVASLNPSATLRHPIYDPKESKN